MTAVSEEPVRPRDQRELARLGIPTRPMPDSPPCAIEVPLESGRTHFTLADAVPANLRLIGIQDAAALYGCNWRTLLRWSDCGLTPKGLKIGGRRLFRLNELQAHIAAGCPKVR